MSIEGNFRDLADMKRSAKEARAPASKGPRLHSGLMCVVRIIAARSWFIR